MRAMILVCTFHLLWGLASLLPVALGDQALGSCGPPPRLDFAELADEHKEKNSFPVGSTVKYKCRPGYIKQPGFKYFGTCLQNQTWSTIQELCQRRKCGHPGEPENGRLVASEDFFFGSHVNYICEDGYKLIGPTSRRCVIDGKGVQWTGKIPLCQCIPCSPPPDIPHGKHSDIYMDVFCYGSVVTYTCEDGYPLVGDAHIHCISKDGLNGEWSGRAYCGVTKCPLPKVENGRIVVGVSDTYKYNQSIIMDCNTGHKISGSREIHCQVDGTWDPPPPHCEQEGGWALKDPRKANVTPGPLDVLISVQHGSSCGPAIKLEFAELLDEYKRNNSFSIGSVVKYSCRPGYVKDPALKASLTCLRNQQWSEVLEFCKRKSCGNPGEPENGRLLVSGDFRFGSTVHYTCEKGHRLLGNSSRRCVIHGKKVVWTGDIPFCQRIPCFPPPVIPHGSHSGIYMDEFYYGQAVTYTCEDGYPLVGEAQIHCTSQDGLNGEWSGRAYCGVTECSLPKIENGRIVAGVSDTYKYNQSVTLGCNNGHKISGSREIHCQMDGTWDPPLPHCERVAVTGCIAPEIQNGRIISTQVVHKLNETVIFECDPGYILKGNQTIQCQIDNTWDSPVPICIKEGSCGPALWLKYAELLDEYKNNNSFPVGSTVRYVCRPGYLKHPGLKASLTCLRNQQWSEFQEFCKRKSCGFPGEPENGRLIVSQDFLFGSTVNYTCEDGYRLVGESSRQCVISGWKVAWTGDTPLCESISCLPPPVIPHGKHTGAVFDHLYYGTVVIYTCEDGYTLVGDTYISCTSKDGLKGEWSGRAYCSAVTYCLPPQIENGRIVVGYSATYTYGQSVTLDCNAGYKISGSKMSHCQVDGTWDPPLPHCEWAVKCCRPPMIANGKYNNQESEGFSNGMFVEYSCEPGYKLTGNRRIFCTESGAWNTLAPNCKLIECPLPPKVQHGKYYALWSTRYTIGKSVRYSCEPGYVLIGEATIHCTSFGVWSLPIPHCEEIQCQSPCSVPHGSYIGPEGIAFTSGKSVKYTCDPGYTLTGEATISCTGSGKWSAPAPHCQAMHCPLPPRMVHGKYIGDEFTYGKSVVYNCDVGYLLIGNHTVTCVLNGSDSVNWTEPPKCKGCLAPPQIANGKVVTGFLREDFPHGSFVTYCCDPGYVTGAATIYITGCIIPEIQNGRITRSNVADEPMEMITFECDPGYVLKGNSVIQCQSESIWDFPTPSCVREIQCQSPCSVPHGSYIAPEGVAFTSGMSVKYTCDPGYTLTGEATISCTGAGTWSAPAPHCEAMGCLRPPGIIHGMYIGEDFTYGNSVIYICDAGYSLIGNHVVTCSLQGSNSVNWTEPPICKGCSAPSVMANGKHDITMTDFPYGSSMTFHCDPGYVLIGVATIHCLSSGIWHRPVPQCKRKHGQTTGCVNPEIQNGRIARAKVDNEHTETITIECNPGYILKGNHTIQCNSDSTWDSRVPICVREIHCQSPPLVLNGSYSNQEAAVFTSGMFVKYTCDSGYTLTGEATIYCTDMGTWSSPAPQCKVVKCHPPPYVQNATHSSQETTVFTSGMSIKYKCELGYTLIGEATVHCTTSGTWSPTAPSCGDLNCPPPPSIAHGKYIGKDFTYGKSVIYVCDAGYSLIGEHVISCILEGSHSVNWTEPPKCKGEQAQKQQPEVQAHMLNGHGNENNPAVGCILPQISGGKKLNAENVIQVGVNVTLECEEGYVLKGSPHVQCKQGFTWDPPVPVCKLGSYSATVIAFGSAGGVLLLIISGGIWVLVSKRNKLNRKIYRGPDIQVQEPSII